MIHVQCNIASTIRAYKTVGPLHEVICAKNVLYLEAKTNLAKADPLAKLGSSETRLRVYLKYLDRFPILQIQHPRTHLLLWFLIGKASDTCITARASTGESMFDWSHSIGLKRP